MFDVSGQVPLPDWCRDLTMPARRIAVCATGKTEQDARQRALEDVARQVRVTVDAAASLNVREGDSGRVMSSEYAGTSQTRAVVTLEDVRFVATDHIGGQHIVRAEYDPDARARRLGDISEAIETFLRRGQLRPALQRCQALDTREAESQGWNSCAVVRRRIAADARIRMLDSVTALVSLAEQPVAGVGLSRQFAESGVTLPPVPPSSEVGVVALPATVRGAGPGGRLEALDIDWGTIGDSTLAETPFRVRATRRVLDTRQRALRIEVRVPDDPESRMVRALLLERLADGFDMSAMSRPEWVLAIEWTVRDLGELYGGERAAAVTLQWRAVPAGKSRAVAEGAVADVRASGNDVAEATQLALRRAVERAVRDINRSSEGLP